MITTAATARNIRLIVEEDHCVTHGMTCIERS